MYSEVGIIGTRHGHPGWMDQQQGRLRNVGCVVQCNDFFHFFFHSVFSLSSASEIPAGSFFAPSPFSKRQPVKGGGRSLSSGRNADSMPEQE